jgi:hypothetical protein
VNSYSICEGESTSSPACLTASSSGYVTLNGYAGSSTQKWKFERISTSTKEGHYRIKNVSTGRYISIASTSENAALTHVSSSTSSTAQRWSLIEIGLDTLGNGSFGIQNAASGRVIDDKQQSYGATCVQASRPDSSNWYTGQAWKLALR